MRPMWPGESQGDSAGSNCGAPNGNSRRGTSQFQIHFAKAGPPHARKSRFLHPKPARAARGNTGQLQKDRGQPSRSRIVVKRQEAAMEHHDASDGDEATNPFIDEEEPLLERPQRRRRRRPYIVAAGALVVSAAALTTRSRATNLATTNRLPVPLDLANCANSVSYTHLTLPTKA